MQIMDGKDINVLESIYITTDCSNKVFDYAMLHKGKHVRAGRLVSEGYAESLDGVEVCDGDGFSTGKTGTGFRLTLKGYEALTQFNPNRYPVDARREWAK